MSFLSLGAIRPHWGQYNHLDAETVKSLYPELPKWKKIYNILNKKGTFENVFTDRCEFKD